MKRALSAMVLIASTGSMAHADTHRDWGGFYAGASAGFATAETTVVGNRFTYNQNRAVNLVEHDYRGGVVQAFAGRNWQSGAIVYGAEISIGTGNLSSNLTFNADNDIDLVELDWFGSATGRIGYATGNTFAYARGGVAFARFRNIGGDVNGGSLTLSDAHIRDAVMYAPTAGVGIEGVVAEDWLVRFEYTVTDYGDYSVANQDGAPGSQVYRIDNGPIRTLSVGLLYEF